MGTIRYMVKDFEGAAKAGDSSPDLDPATMFVKSLVLGLGRLAAAQDELLRLARIVDERAAEVDGATQRAREFLQVELDADPDEFGLQRIIDAVVAPDDEDGLNEEDRREALANAIEVAVEDLPEGQASAYLQAVGRALSGPPSGHYLHRSLLVSMVGELEMFVDSIARACFAFQPEVLNGSEQALTWKDLAQYSSLDEVRDALVDRTIEDVLRGSLKDWMGFFSKKFSVSPVTSSDGFAVQELFQRRHCVVHNAGFASNLYMRKLKDFKELNVSEGDLLEVTSDYLHEAADTLYFLAFSLIWSTGFGLLPEGGDRTHLARHLTNEVYFMIQRNRHDLVIRICGEAPVGRLPEEQRLIFLVNNWLAHKRSGRFNAVESEVRNFNTSTKSRNFKLARLALLDELQEAWQLAQVMLRDGELAPAHYATWPLLSEVRAYGEEQRDVRSS